MLDRIRAKDELTYAHSLEVARLASSTWPVFAEELEAAGITQADMVRAGALHDVGKLILPDSVLENDLGTEELRVMLREFIEDEPDEATALLRSKGKLSDKRTVRELSDDVLASIDPRDALPLEYLFRNNPTAQAEIISAGFDPHMTFMDALKKHETASAEIISGSEIDHRALVAALASAHHNYRGIDRLVYEQDGIEHEVPVTAVELLHQIDVYQSMTGQRQYQQSMTEDQARARLEEMAEKKILNADILKRWMSAQQSNS